MRLSSFQIKSFKSIVDTGICNLSENDNIVVLAGQNEAGKSAVVEALSFFGNGPSPKFEKLHRRKEEHPEVICEFALDTDDIENIFIETENDSLKKELIKNNKIGFIRCPADDNSLDTIFFTDETEERLKPFFVKPNLIEVKSTSGESTPASGADKTKEGTTAESKKTPARNTIEKLLEFLISEKRRFVFYDSFDDLLPGEVTIKDISKYSAVQDFQKVFGVNFAEIVKKDSRSIARSDIDLSTRASDDLNKYWTQKLEENSRYNFKVKIIRKTPADDSTVEFMIDRADGDPLYLEQKSNGFRWFSAFNLRLRALGVEETTIKNLVILIDEPGQGLHEKAQKDLKTVLEELGTKGAQIVYTTHYPNLIGTVGREFARIRLVSNTNQRGTKVETAAKFASRSDVGASDALSPIITAMGIQSVGAILDPSRLNILVEGITDHYYLSAIKKLLGKSERFHFLPACGVNNIPNLASVLIGWGFNFKAVLDDDTNSGRKAYTLLKKEFYEENDTLAHDHILKIKDCNGIEDVFSTKDFYKHILKEKSSTGTTQANSTVAKGKKELLARLFMERVEGGEAIQLDKQTLAKFEEVFTWLNQKFGL